MSKGTTGRPTNHCKKVLRGIILFLWTLGYLPVLKKLEVATLKPGVATVRLAKSFYLVLRVYFLDLKSMFKPIVHLSLQKSIQNQYLFQIEIL